MSQKTFNFKASLDDDDDDDNESRTLFENSFSMIIDEAKVFRVDFKQIAISACGPFQCRSSVD